MTKKEFVNEVKKLNALVYSFVGTTENDWYVGDEDRCANYETIFKIRQNKMFSDKKFYQQMGGWFGFNDTCVEDFCGYYYDMLELNNLEIIKIDFVSNETLFVIVKKG